MAEFRICAAICVHDDVAFLEPVLRALEGIETFLFVSDLNWIGKPGECSIAAEIGDRNSATVVCGSWRDESSHRIAAIDHVRELGYSHMLVLDSDEVIEPNLLKSVQSLAEHGLADRVHVSMETYWKTPEHRIRPAERLMPCVLVDLERTRYLAVRDFEGGRPVFLDASHGVLHHLSYAGPEERIWKKINTWGHRHELVPGWWERVWKGWDVDQMMRDLHPTHPPAYGFVERIELPEALYD